MMYGYAQRRKSWKTTAAGIAALLALVGNAAAAILDDDPETNPNWDALGVAILAVGSMFARDNDVTSEESGAK